MRISPDAIRGDLAFYRKHIERARRASTVPGATLLPAPMALLEEACNTIEQLLDQLPKEPDDGVSRT